MMNCPTCQAPIHTETVAQAMSHVNHCMTTFTQPGDKTFIHYYSLAFNTVLHSDAVPASCRYSLSFWVKMFETFLQALQCILTSSHGKLYSLSSHLSVT